MPSGTRLIQYVQEFNSLFTLWTIIKKWTLFYACDALLLAKSYHRKRCFVKYLFHVIMNMFVLTRGIINDESIKINIHIGKNVLLRSNSTGCRKISVFRVRGLVGDILLTK
jgi:hypothetical protein